MDDAGGVHEEDAPEDLVDEILDMVVTELLPGVDNPMQVGLHKVSNDVNVGVIPSSPQASLCPAV